MTTFLRFLDHTQLDKHIWYDSSETVISLSQTMLRTQHETNIHACSGIQTHDCSNQVATAISRYKNWPSNNLIYTVWSKF